jgi:hypothetical protein
MPGLAEDGFEISRGHPLTCTTLCHLSLPLSFRVVMNSSNNIRVQLPLLDLSSPKTTSTARGRGRSNSIVKVEEVGNRSTEEVLDRSAYVNINADWVNAKGSSLMIMYSQ